MQLRPRGGFRIEPRVLRVRVRSTRELAPIVPVSNTARLCERVTGMAREKVRRKIT